VTLFIASVNFEADEEAVRALFEEVGPVRRFTLVKTDGRLRGYGFVEFENDLDALRAIDTLNNRYYMGRRLVVQESKEKNDGNIRGRY